MFGLLMDKLKNTKFFSFDSLKIYHNKNVGNKIDLFYLLILSLTYEVASNKF
jgi:hypothetical protein